MRLAFLFFAYPPGCLCWLRHCTLRLLGVEPENPWGCLQALNHDYSRLDGPNATFCYLGHAIEVAATLVLCK